MRDIWTGKIGHKRTSTRYSYKSTRQKVFLYFFKIVSSCKNLSQIFCAQDPLREITFGLNGAADYMRDKNEAAAAAVDVVWCAP